MEADHYCDTLNGGLRIALIGGGATGVSLLDAIQIEAKYQHLNVDLTLYEPDKRIGPGRAYQCDGEYALLNRQARFILLRNMILATSFDGCVRTMGLNWQRKNSCLTTFLALICLRVLHHKSPTPARTAIPFKWYVSAQQLFIRITVA